METVFEKENEGKSLNEVAKKKSSGNYLAESSFKLESHSPTSSRSDVSKGIKSKTGKKFINLNIMLINLLSFLLLL